MRKPKTTAERLCVLCERPVDPKSKAKIPVCRECRDQGLAQFAGRAAPVLAKSRAMQKANKPHSTAEAE